jgi:hypothetical protein
MGSVRVARILRKESTVWKGESLDVAGKALWCNIPVSFERSTDVQYRYFNSDLE